MLGFWCLPLGLLVIYPQGQRALLFLTCSLPQVGTEPGPARGALPDLSPRADTGLPAISGAGRSLRPPGSKFLESSVVSAQLLPHPGRSSGNTCEWIHTRVADLKRDSN